MPSIFSLKQKVSMREGWVLRSKLRSLTPAGGNQGGDEKRISAKSSKVTRDEKKQTESDSGKGLDD